MATPRRMWRTDWPSMAKWRAAFSVVTSCWFGLTANRNTATGPPSRPPASRRTPPRTADSGYDDGEEVASTLASSAAAAAPAPPTSATLTWDDFRQVAERPAGQTTDALTVWKYEYQQSGFDYGDVTVAREGAGLKITTTITSEPEVKFTAIFDRQASYVLKRLVANSPRLLQHEIHHLRMAEYLASKANANLPKLKGTKVSVVVPIRTSVADAKTALAKAVEVEVKRILDAHLTKLGQISKAIHDRYDGRAANDQPDDGTDSGTLPVPQASWERDYKAIIDREAQKQGWPN